VSHPQTIKDLIPDPANARLHNSRNVGMIAAALQKVGAARSIVIDEDGQVLAGNATIQAAAEAGIENVRVIDADGQTLIAVRRTGLSPEEKKQLAYFDNRTAELADWNVEQIAADWEAGLPLEDFWNERELALLLEEAPHSEHEIDDFDEVPDQLPGAAALKPDMVFASEEIYDIPSLLPEMLAELPQPLDVWAGPDASDLAWEGWWLYCYGSDSVRGLDLSRTILAFYVDDVRFERWYTAPDVYVAKALNAGIPVAIAPNFSLWHGVPRAVHLFNTFRSRWLARYFQEAGLAVIPDVNWADERSFEFCLAGIPRRAPCVSIQVQTVSGEAETGRLKHGVGRAIRELDPESLLLYGGGRATKKALAGVLPDELSVVWLDSRVIRRHDRVMSKSQ
jgi:hypothetical protein